MGNTSNKSIGYHGIQDVVAIMRIVGVPGTEKIEVPYAQNLSLQAVINEIARYADNRKVGTRYSNNGYTGNLGFTARDSELEAAAGIQVSIEGGIARASARGAVSFDIFYKHIEAMEDGSDRLIKNWLRNVSLGPPEENYETDSDNIEFGAYVYPITVLGDKAMKNATEVWVDENGMETTLTYMRSSPGESNYETFGDAVPAPIIVDVTP